MPTTRARYTLTETDELAAALEAAASRWPEHAESRQRLLLQLIQAGERAINGDLERQQAARRAAVERTHGQFRGMYVPGYLDDLRDEWPD